MRNNLEMHRSGITLVSDDQVLEAVAGGVDIGDATLDLFLETKWVAITAGVLYGLYYYGDPYNRGRVVAVCRQIVLGARQVGRDAVFLGVAAKTTLAQWIRDYFAARAGNNAATSAAQVCPSIP